MKKEIFLVIMSVFLLSGCNGMFKSGTPTPETYDYSKQKKMQAAQHWNLLAGDTAGQIKKTYSGRGLNGNINVVEHKGVFAEAFADMLTTHLVRQNMPVNVKSTKNPDVLNLEYEVQVVKHEAGRHQRPTPGLFTGLALVADGIYALRNVSKGVGEALVMGGAAAAGALIDLGLGRLAEVSHYEVIVTTSLIRDNTYLTRKTDVYYINDPDWRNYQMLDDVQSVTYSVVGE